MSRRLFARGKGTSIKHLTKHGALVACGYYYNLFNREVFNGRLPKCKFEIKAINALADYTLRRFYRAGKPYKSIAYVRIHPHLAHNTKLLVRELIHEIVHIAWPKLSHGYEFQRRMVRIAGNLSWQVF